MMAVQLTGSDLSRLPVSKRSTAATKSDEQAVLSPAEGPATVTAQFQRLDPSIVNEAIPAFFVGRNQEGFWVARDVEGQVGGIFLLERSALSFAKRNSQPAGCVTIFPSERFELDLDNKGNPLVVHLGSLIHLAIGVRRRVVGFIDKMTDAVERRFRNFHAL
jgi:hypothetical protein